MFFISSFYSIGIGLAKMHIIKKSKKSEYEKYMLSGIMVVIASIAYIIYSAHGFMYGMRTNYNMYISIGIATISFTEIILAIIGIVKTRKSQDLESRIIKLLNLAGSFSWISLTQTALLSFCMVEDNSTANGFFGMLMGGFSLIVGAYIIMYVRKNKEQYE
jgi:hypothetical protein